MTKLTVLVVDHDPDRRSRIVQALAEGFDCLPAGDLDTAYAALGRGDFWASVVAYSFAGDGSGIELLQGVHELAPRTFRVLYSAHYSQGMVRDATRLARAHAVVNAGEERFPASLCDTLDRLVATLEAPVMELGAGPASVEVPPWRAVSTVTRSFLGELRRAAESDSTVFLHGEPGCGKHLAAQTLQRWRKEWSSTPREGQEAARTSTVLLNVPPLRDRVQDLPLLAEDVLVQFSFKIGEPEARLTQAALEALRQRRWPGNVRELQVVLHRAATIARDAGRREILAEDLSRAAGPARSPSQLGKDEGQLDTVLRELRAAGSVRGASKLERIPRANYMRLMRRLGVIRADGRPYGEDEPE